MSLYLEQIRQLVALQHVDDAIHGVKNELKTAPQEVEDLSRRFSVQEEQRNKVLDRLQHIKEQQKRIEQEIEDDNTRLKKSRSKLMQVENNREYQAMEREMDSMERQSRSREEERMAIQDGLSSAENDLKDMDGAWTALKAELEVKQDNLAQRMADANAKLASLEDRRADTGSEVPAPVLARYEFIRRRLEHPVIVPVDNGICTGCHIAIPPQIFIEIQRGQQIHSCPNCQRLIYWDHHFQDTTPKPAPAPKIFAENAESPEGTTSKDDEDQA